MNHEELKKRWVALGAKWHSTIEPPPIGWNWETQVQRGASQPKVNDAADELPAPRVMLTLERVTLFDRPPSFVLHSSDRRAL